MKTAIREKDKKLRTAGGEWKYGDKKEAKSDENFIPADIPTATPVDFIKSSVKPLYAPTRTR